MTVYMADHRPGKQGAVSEITVPDGLITSDAIMLAVTRTIIAEQLGAISMNHYCAPGIRVYTNLVRTVGRKGKQRFEYVGTDGYLEFTA